MQTRNYLLYDVFTTERLAGNPLAVVLDSKGLDTAAMQAIAREFNLSESVFVLPPDNPKHRNRIRILLRGRQPHPAQIAGAGQHKRTVALHGNMR